MGLSQSDSAVNEQRIVMISRLVGHGHGSGVGKLIACTNNKILKGVPGNQVVMALRTFPVALFVILGALARSDFLAHFLLNVECYRYFLLRGGAQRRLDLNKKMLRQPIPKKLVRYVEEYLIVIARGKFDRLNPGFITLLPHAISKIEQRFLPQLGHVVTS